MIIPPDLFVPGDPFEVPVSDDLLRSVESELGFALPSSYVDLCRVHNGGLLALDAYPVGTPTTFADDHIGVYSLAAIGRTAADSLCGERGSRFWVEEWGYPEVGVYFADCPSAGHDMLALDYRGGGEPTVIHIDQELDYRVTLIAPSFEVFITGLRREDTFAD